MATAKGGKTTKLVRGQPVDKSEYGKRATGAKAQMFWDDPPEDEYENPVGIIGSLYGSSPWDRVSLGGSFLPGLWEATATPAIQLDVQKPNGFDGAALVSRGYVPAGITMTGRLWTPEQWQEWQSILPTFWAPPNKYAVNDQKRQEAQIQGKEKSVTVLHPGLNAMNIHWLVIKQITPPEPAETGVRQIKIIAVEYVPEPQRKKPATKKVSGISKDRTVQAEQILGLGSSPYGNLLKPTMPENARNPPSKAQAHKT